MYKKLIKPLLFSFDPELVHDLVMAAAGRLGRFPGAVPAMRSLFACRAECLEVELFGLRFPNPFGLAAGFDKDCRAVDFFCGLGFGHIEIGTVTAQAQAGNPKPRIFRLPGDRALINRMGFPSAGAQAAAQRLARLKAKKLPIIIGVNIGKSRAVEVDQALPDYLESFRLLKDLGDYFVLNVSSPNTPQLRKLQERGRLEQLFRGVGELNTARRPLLVKIAPDLNLQQVDEILDCCLRCDISGLIATNTTVGREGLSRDINEEGGLSGPPLKHKALQMASYIYKQSAGQIPVIGVGGVESFEDVLAMFKAGASLIQIYTALVFEGPGLAGRLAKKLQQYLAREGLKSPVELTGQG